MEVRDFRDAEEFAAATSGLLSGTEEQEMENNLAVGLIERLRRGDYKNAFLLAVMENDRPVLAALMTPPRNLVLSRGEKGAIPLLVKEIQRKRLTVPGIVGPADMAESFIAEWRRTTGQRIETRLKMTFYAVRDVVVPAKPVPGIFRQATKRDVAWLTDWLVRFAIDSNLDPYEQKRDEEGTAKKIELGLLYVWEENGVPKSIAGYMPVTANGARIGYVYTSPEERGKGYASACVARLSQKVLDSGRKWCCLFADMANPTSNGIYKRIGYEERFTYQECKFLSHE